MLVLKRRAGQGLVIGEDIVRFLRVSSEAVDGAHIDPEGEVRSWSLFKPRFGDALQIGRATIRIKALDNDGTSVILAIDAPREVSIFREELGDYKPRGNVTP